MKYRTLGRTGFEVSEIGHGLWGMSCWSGSSDRESLESMDIAIQHGCNFFDTAWAYGDGHSDELLGQILAKYKHKRLYAASKIPPKNGKWPARSKYKYRDVFPSGHVFEHTEKILRKMKADAIDILQLHVWDDTWAKEAEFRETVEKLKAENFIRAFGLSLNRWEPENGIAAIRTGLIDTVQVIYNIFDQAPEDELLPLCEKMNIGVIARVPLDEGSLGGKMTLDSKFPPSDWRSRYFGPENLKQTIARVDKLKKDLPPGASLPDVALRFVLSHPAVSTEIVGMRKPDHVRHNVAASDAPPLDPSLMAALRKHRWDRRPEPWSD